MAACLGLDYGLRRIGIAAGDTETSLAFALTTHVEGRDGSVFTTLAALISERQVGLIVVGLPLTASGDEGELAVRARAFSEKLAGRFADDSPLQVVLWDERYSSQEADRWLRRAASSTREDRDAVAAAIILQSYLDSLIAGDSS